MSTEVQMLLRKPLGAHPADVDLAAETLMQAAANALRPGRPQAVTWRTEQPGRPGVPGGIPDDPALQLRWQAGRPVGGSGEMECIWHREGGPVVWAYADAPPIPHYAELRYTLRGDWMKWADGEFDRWLALACPPLAQWEPWVNDPVRGQCYPWTMAVGYLTRTLAPEDGGPDVA